MAGHEQKTSSPPFVDEAAIVMASYTDIDASYDDTVPVGDIHWTVEEETAVRRKFDFTIVPVVTYLYLLCFIDRANIGNARIQGLSEDLNLRGFRYNEVLTMFYVVYLAVEIPSNIILKRVGPRFWIPFLAFGFGLMSMCTAFVQSYVGLCFARAFLAVFEGGTMPGIAFFLSCYYRRGELFLRIGIFVAASALAGAFGGLLAAGLTRIPSWGTAAVPIHGWRNIFFIEGLITVVSAIAAVWLLPQSPATYKFLTPRQRYIAAERIRREQAANPKENVTIHDVKLAIFSIHTNVCAWCFFCTNVCVQGMAAFVPTLLRELGWTSTQAQLLSVPPYAIAAVATILLGYISDRKKKRGIYIASVLALPIIGFGILRFSKSVNARYAAIYLNAIGAFSASSGFLAWGINNAGSQAAGAVAGAYIVAIASLGGVLSTWTYLSRDAPRFEGGHSINLSLQICAFVLVCLGIIHCKRENKLRDQGKRDNRIEGLEDHKRTALGHRSPDFRYMP